MFDKLKTMFNKKQTEQKNAKEIATEAGEPYIKVLDTNVDAKNPKYGYFELDWNQHFVENLKKQMRRFLEAHGEEVKGDNELDKSENKILDLSRKMDMIYEKLNQKKIDMLDQNNEEESPYESSGDVTNTEHLNIEEARDILVGLREDYRREYKDIPREEGILTNSIIDFIIQNQIFEKEVLLKSPSEIIGKVNKRQFEKIEDILSVIKRVRFE